MRTQALLCLLSFAPLSLTVQAQDLGPEWPQFHGPNGTSMIGPIDSDFAWGEAGPKVHWKVAVEKGFGGPAIRDGKVFVMDREPGGGEGLRVYDLTSGEALWRCAYESKGRVGFPGARCVPTVSESMVFLTGGHGEITAISRESHEVVWQFHCRDFGGEQPIFGWSHSPLLYGDAVIVSPLGEDVGLVAFDAESGEELWVSDPLGYSHSSPTMLNLDGMDQVLFMSTPNPGSGRDQAAPCTMTGLDPEDGSIIWQYNLTLTGLTIPGPIKIDEERLFVTGGYRGGSVLLKFAVEDGEYSFEELFRIERGAQVHKPVRFEEHLYYIVNENWNDSRSRRKEGGLLCLSLDGEEVWRTADDPYLGRGHMILAGDKLIIQDGYNGTLRIVPASPEGFAPIAEASLFGFDDNRDHQLWAPMAYSNGLLIMRSQDEMICVEL
ncbi:MAG: outer membrane protein assembly factor BamB [Planctomycetota bacterium]|jgi:outer membrane protein assembly factor BamB